MISARKTLTLMYIGRFASQNIATEVHVGSKGRQSFCAKKILQPLLDTHEGTKMTWTSLFLTSPTLTVYSNVQPLILEDIFEPKFLPVHFFWNLRMWLDSIFWELSKRNSMDFRMLSSLLELPSPWNGNVCTFQDAFRELAVSGNVTKFFEDLNANLDIWRVLVGARCCWSVSKIYTSQSTNSDILIVVFDYFPYVKI